MTAGPERDPVELARLPKRVLIEMLTARAVTYRSVEYRNKYLFVVAHKYAPPAVATVRARDRARPPDPAELEARIALLMTESESYRRAIVLLIARLDLLEARLENPWCVEPCPWCAAIIALEDEDDGD